jgi:hypothetical protein
MGNKLVLVPCKKENGRIVSKNMIRPYGYHHIRRVYLDGSSWLVATIDARYSEEIALKIAAQLIPDDDTAIETDSDFYAKMKEV